MTHGEESEEQLRRQVCDVGHRLARQNYVTAMDGNISVRLGDDRFLLTPTQCSLGRLEPEELVVINGDGETLEGEAEPTSEYRLHVTCYERRPDVNAVVHAHPPNCVAASVAGVDLTKPVVPEVVFTLGAIPTTPYGTPGGEGSCRVIRDYVDTYDAILLDRHGVVTQDGDLEGAYMKMEKAENAAEVHMKARQVGIVRVLPRDEVERLKEMGKKYGLNPEAVPEANAYEETGRE